MFVNASSSPVVSRVPFSRSFAVFFLGKTSVKRNPQWPGRSCCNDIFSSSCICSATSEWPTERVGGEPREERTGENNGQKQWQHMFCGRAPGVSAVVSCTGLLSELVPYGNARPPDANSAGPNRTRAQGVSERPATWPKRSIRLVYLLFIYRLDRGF